MLDLNINTIQFLILTQLIIFILGWPLEWSEIIIIFVPIFLPLLGYFDVDPLFFGILIAINLQTSFLTPPMAMSAYYLKGVAPPGVKLVTIFKGCLPFCQWFYCHWYWYMYNLKSLLHCRLFLLVNTEEVTSMWRIRM